MSVHKNKFSHSVWIEATENDVFAITLQNKGKRPVEVAITEGSAPNDVSPTIVLGPYGFIMNEYLSDLAPGLANPTRVFFRNAKVFVSHA